MSQFVWRRDRQVEPGMLDMLDSGLEEEADGMEDRHSISVACFCDGLMGNSNRNNIYSIDSRSKDS